MAEQAYLSLLSHVLENGIERNDRTGVGVLSCFGNQIRMNIEHSVPLLTTKRVAWKQVIHELLWFLRGDTDVKLLQKEKVKIWDLNTSREFLDSRGLGHYPEFVLGPGYGFQWRFFGAKYSVEYADTSKVDVQQIGGFDQIKYIEDQLKTNPYSRRIMLNAWNPLHMNEMALVPCHYGCQFYVFEKNDKRYLSCMVNLRSNDLFLGAPFNLFSYTVLTYLFALKCDMIPYELVYTVGDYHIYLNHLSQVKEQLLRVPSDTLPTLSINPLVKDKDWNEITIDDFKVLNYNPQAPIKAPMAV